MSYWGAARSSDRHSRVVDPMVVVVVGSGVPHCDHPTYDPREPG